MAKLYRIFRSQDAQGKTERHVLEGLERVTAPPVEASAYEFMLENLVDSLSNRFDRWRNRMPQR